MSPLLGGLVGALGAYLVVRYLSRRIRNGEGDGTLAYEPFVNRLGWIALIGLAVLAHAVLSEQTAPPTVMQWIWMLVLATAAFYCLLEGNLSKGWFDDAGICFNTPWAGKRKELWCDLRSAHYSSACACYVLKFKSGKTIRLSVLLGGHGGVLTRLRGWGYRV